MGPVKPALWFQTVAPPAEPGHLLWCLFQHSPVTWLLLSPPLPAPARMLSALPSRLCRVCAHPLFQVRVKGCFPSGPRFLLPSHPSGLFPHPLHLPLLPLLWVVPSALFLVWSPQRRVLVLGVSITQGVVFKTQIPPQQEQQQTQTPTLSPEPQAQPAE